MEKFPNITPLEFKKLEEAVMGNEDATFNSNDNDLVDSFFERFKQKTIKLLDHLPDGFDLNDGKAAYGKVDTKGRIIFPNEEGLSRIGPKFADEKLYLNEVAYNLYLDFYTKTREEIALGIKNMDQFSSVYNIDKASASPSQIITNYKEKFKEEIKEIFIDTVAPDYTSIKDNAKDFQSYLEIILKLFEHNMLPKETLLSEYILSTENSILNTGLAFEIPSEVDYDDDEQKFIQFLSQDPYQEIMVLLLQHGWRYDNNVPWRFILDLNRPETKKILKGLSKQEFFDKYYFEIDGTLVEMALFFEVIFLSYLELLEESPLYSIIKQETKCGTKQASSRALKRKHLSTKQFTTYFDKNFSLLLKKYAITLNHIFNKNKNPQGLLLFVSNNVKKGLDRETLVRYTFTKIKHC
jgi:hypothetical protein